MKKLIFGLLFSLIAIAACTGIKTSTQGLENESFLEFIGNPDNYVGGVLVNIDKEISFMAEVKENNADVTKGKVYAISTGKHVISVYYNEKVIYQKQIFVSAQETKKVLLP
jgi:hypothetical protein